MTYEIIRVLDATELYNHAGESIPYRTYEGKVYREGKTLSVGAADASLEAFAITTEKIGSLMDLCGTHPLPRRCPVPAMWSGIGRGHNARDWVRWTGFRACRSLFRGRRYEVLGEGKAGAVWVGKYAQNPSELN